MSLWKFGNFEAEVNFSDADFLDKVDCAKQALDEQLKHVQKTGKMSDIIRSRCKCFYTFFDTLFYEGAANEMYDGKNDLELCVQSADSIFKFQQEEDERWRQSYGKYNVQNHGNRQQRRAYQKNNKKNYPRKQG